MTEMGVKGFASLVKVKENLALTPTLVLMATG